MKKTIYEKKLTINFLKDRNYFSSKRPKLEDLETFKGPRKNKNYIKL